MPEGEAFEPTTFQEEASPKLLFALKPVFLPWVTLFSAIPVQLITTLMGGGLFGIAGYIVVKELPLNVPGWLPFAVSSGIFFLLVPIIAYVSAKNRKKRIEYRFYTTKLEYADELSPKEKKTLHYKDVFGMRLSQGRSQRKHDVGTLVLLTLATEDYRKDMAHSGVTVADIPSPYKVYTQIKERLNSISHQAKTSTGNTSHGSKIPTGSPLEKVGAQEPLLVLKPVFLPWVTLLSMLPGQIGGSLLGGGLLGMVGGLVLKTVDVMTTLQVTVPVWLPAAVIGGFLFFAIPIMGYSHKKKTYKHTGYGFYATEFTRYTGTSPVELTTIHYANISNVSLKKGFFQKKYGMGTLFLLTRADSEAGRDIARSRFKLPDIPNPDEAYVHIKELVNRTS